MSRTRRGHRIALAGAAAATAALALTSCNPTGSGHVDAIVYGDSIAEETAGAIAFGAQGHFTVAVGAVGGTALCDWLSAIGTDLRVRHPRVIALSFIGNSQTACMMSNGGTIRQRYQNAAVYVLAAAAHYGTRVLFLRAPVSGNGYGDPGWVDAYRPDVADVGAAVAPGDRFTLTEGCYGWESTADGCSSGQIQVRSTDDTHLQTPGFPVSPNGYQAGELRYGFAIDGALETALTR